jgi:hypothetical protein
MSYLREKLSRLETPRFVGGIANAAIDLLPQSKSKILFGLMLVTFLHTAVLVDKHISSQSDAIILMWENEEDYLRSDDDQIAIMDTDGDVQRVERMEESYGATFDFISAAFPYVIKHDNTSSSAVNLITREEVVLPVGPDHNLSTIIKTSNNRYIAEVWKANPVFADAPTMYFYDLHSKEQLFSSEEIDTENWLTSQMSSDGQYVISQYSTETIDENQNTTLSYRFVIQNLETKETQEVALQPVPDLTSVTIIDFRNGQLILKKEPEEAGSLPNSSHDSVVAINAATSEVETLFDTTYPEFESLQIMNAVHVGNSLFVMAKMDSSWRMTIYEIDMASGELKHKYHVPTTNYYDVTVGDTAIFYQGWNSERMAPILYILDLKNNALVDAIKPGTEASQLVGENRADGRFLPTSFAEKKSVPKNSYYLNLGLWLLTAALILRKMRS